MKRIVAAAFALLLLTGCGEEEVLPPEVRPMMIAFDGSPTNLDSRVGNDQNSGRIFDLVYIGLVHVATDGTYEPVVAESWEMPDDTTIVFHIRPGLVFHDGSPLTARDVRYTYDSMMSEGFPGAKASGYIDVESIETPDDQTVVFNLKKPNAGIFDNLTVGIVPEGADPETMKEAPIGAGPFRLIEYRVDERVRLEAFEDYFKGPPGLAKVTIRVVPDATTRILELRKGTIDFEINAIPYDAVKLFSRLDPFQVMA
ncbi:MAG: ABC transporter substrate-binding protein, partial [Thermoanaerobaculia bacterium]|nr:ABC transporter substrate-binding protein [Thermoanaerobaculia bacterium]